MGLPIAGVLDLNPIYSQWINCSNEPVCRKAAVTFLDEDRVPSLSLRTMVANALSIQWHKDKAITCSDWSQRNLSLEQLKYAVLDAWASCAVGCVAIINLMPFGVLDLIFSTLLMDNTLQNAHNGKHTLKAVLQQSAGLSELQNVTKPIIVSNMQWNSQRGVRTIHAYCDTYGNHIRVGSNNLEIKVYSPGGSPDGIAIEMQVDDVTGRSAILTVLNVQSPTTLSKVPDQIMARNLAMQPAREIVNLWRREYDYYGPYNSTRETNNWSINKVHRVRLFSKDSGNVLDRQLHFAVSRFVRSHQMGDCFFSQPAESSIDKSRCIQDKWRLTKAFDILSGRAFDNCTQGNLSIDEVAAIETHSHYLTEAQHQAVDRAFRNQVSVICGPPGTGKTRSIAAIADVALSSNRRVLIVAPANSASRRILESLVNIGFEDACLIVSEEYFLEWHQASYADSISQYVHTKRKLFEDEHDHRRYQVGSGSANDRAARDFRHRSCQEHNGKWSSVASGVDTRKESKPSVIIGTFGCIASCIGDSQFESRRSTNKLRSWSKELNNLLDTASIDMIVIDETSQLWFGGAITLFSACPVLQNIVLVGDDNQLPPYGTGLVPELQSLFSMALKHAHIPKTLLNITFRLPSSVGSLVSSAIYDNQLKLGRSESVDLQFSELMREMKFDSTSIMQSIITRYLNAMEGDNPFASLMWIHQASAPHFHPETHSIGNIEEARIIGKCVADLLNAYHVHMITRTIAVSNIKDHSLPRKFAILTPYSEQKDQLERALATELSKTRFMSRDYPAQIDWVKSSLIVNTVDSFQGQEADIVFISPARSMVPSATSSRPLSGLGFFKSQERSNVMLTRASQMLVIIGDADNMVKAFTNFGPGSLLLPSMAAWASENGSMYSIASSSSLIPVLKPKVLMLFSGHTGAPNVQTAVNPNNKSARSSLASKKMRGPAFDSFAAKVVRHIVAHKGAMHLSVLGQLVPKSDRPSKFRTLIQPVRSIPNVEVLLVDNIWSVELRAQKEGTARSTDPTPAHGSVSAPTIVPGTSPISSAGTIVVDQLIPNKVKISLSKAQGWSEEAAPDPVEAFVGQVQQLLFEAGGSLRCTAIGIRYPSNRRPPQFRKLLSALSKYFSCVGDLVVLKSETIEADSKKTDKPAVDDSYTMHASAECSDSVDAFVEQVRQLLQSAGGSMLCSHIGSKIPPNERPQQFRKLSSALSKHFDCVGDKILLRNDRSAKPPSILHTITTTQLPVSAKHEDSTIMLNVETVKKKLIQAGGSILIAKIGLKYPRDKFPPQFQVLMNAILAADKDFHVDGNLLILKGYSTSQFIKRVRSILTRPSNRGFAKLSQIESAYPIDQRPLFRQLAECVHLFPQEFYAVNDIVIDKSALSLNGLKKLITMWGKGCLELPDQETALLSAFKSHPAIFEVKLNVHNKKGWLVSIRDIGAASSKDKTSISSDHAFLLVAPFVMKTHQVLGAIGGSMTLALLGRHFRDEQLLPSSKLSKSIKMFPSEFSIYIDIVISHRDLSTSVLERIFTHLPAKKRQVLQLDNSHQTLLNAFRKFPNQFDLTELQTDCWSIEIKSNRPAAPASLHVSGTILAAGLSKKPVSEPPNELSLAKVAEQVERLLLGARGSLTISEIWDLYPPSANLLSHVLVAYKDKFTVVGDLVVSNCDLSMDVLQHIFVKSSLDKLVIPVPSSVPILMAAFQMHPTHFNVIQGPGYQQWVVPIKPSQATCAVQ